MHFQLLELDVLLELLELLLVELCRAALTLSSNVVFDKEFPSSTLLWWNAPFSYYIASKQFLRLGPACAVLALRCGFA